MQMHLFDVLKATRTQLLFSVEVINMRTVKQELIILSSIYVVCLLLIPLILLCTHSFDGLNNNRKNFSELEFQRKVLIDAVTILDTLNEKADIEPGRFAFSDLLNSTEEEFLTRYPLVLFPAKLPPGLERKQKRNVWQKFNFVNATVLRSKSLRLPLRVDWREKKVISSVKTQQASCGSCFALSVIETIESMMALKRGQLDDLSIQQMLDCNEYGMKCEGGDPCRLLQWLYHSQTDVQLKEDYPPLKNYSQTQACDTEKLKDSGIKVKDYLCNDFINQEQLMLLYLANQGPLSAAINALPLKAHKKNDIVQRNCDSEKQNHVVQIVGYDMMGEVPYYIVKNSWGTSFGEDGFMKLAIGSNICGIAKKVSAVVV